MHVGNHYSFKEVIIWTRRDIYYLTAISAIAVGLYEFLDLKWLALPWLPLALLGTAVAFVVGFKNNASYDRMWEARKIWGSIVNNSRSWAILSKDYITNAHVKNPVSEEELKSIHLALYKRHFAWLTALRFQLREPKTWESIYLVHNQEYKNKWFKVDEHENKLDEVLKKYLIPDEYDLIISKTNKAAQIIALQSSHLKSLMENGFIEDFRHMELEKLLVEFFNQQGASERIKNFPYPRQFGTLNLWFTKIFVHLIPLGMLLEFEKVGEGFIWLTVPFAALSSWIFTTMEKIGEASENPFEGSANDIPITAMSRAIEIDMMEILNVSTDLKPLKPSNNILT